MALGNIRAQNSNTYLGLVWWVLSPLLLGMVFLLVFGVILDSRRGDPDYIGFLLSGLFAFYYTRGSVLAGAVSIQQNTKLVSTKRFPRMILPIASIIEAAISFLFSLIPFFVIAGFVGGDWPTPLIWVAIPAFVFQTLFNIGMTSLISLLAIPFRDLTNLTPLLTRVWLYTSPVIFPLDERLKNVSETLFNIFSLNPMASILGLWRTALLGRPLQTRDMVGAAVWGIGIALVGFFVFMRNEHRLVKYL